jgi:hypothetical protein
MQVYVVLQSVRYEGSWIEGIFTTLELAEKYKSKLDQEEHMDYVSYIIETYTLNSKE